MSSFTLILGLYGDATLKEDDAVIWETQDNAEALEKFGEFIEEDAVDDILDYLLEKELIEDSEEVEIIVEVPMTENGDEAYVIPAGEEE